MKTLFFLFALTAFGQPNRHDAMVTRLTADLMARNMNQFATDLNRLYVKGPVTRDFAYALDDALAGRSLSDENLTPVVNGILEGFNAAFAWQGNDSGLLESDAFRDAVKQIYYPLTRLGVGVPETQAVLRLYFRAANHIANPIIRRIPK